MKIVIGIIGPIASGKDTAAEYISKKFGTPMFQTSSVLREIARERNIAETRKNLILLSREVTKEHGGDYIAKTLLERIKDRGIITGMREIAQIEYLRKNANFTLIAADQRIENNADLNELFRKVEDIIDKIAVVQGN